MSQSLDTSEAIERIKEAFPELSNEEKTKAFAQLARMQGIDGASAIMGLMRQYAINGMLPENIIWSLDIVQEHTSVYFPELLDYAAIPKFGHRIYALCAIYISSKWLSPDKLEPHLNGMMLAYRSLKNQLIQIDDYPDSYNQIYSLLEILGYFPKPEIEVELRIALDFYAFEEGLKYQAINSLWKLGKQVADKYILDLIANDLMRWTMFWRLQERGELSLFPAQYRTGEAFARATIASMMDVQYSTKPKSMELVQTCQVNSKNKKANGNYYVYRVFTDFGERAEYKWIAAWAGPIQQDFDFLNMKRSQVIFNYPGMGWEEWDNKPTDELVMKHLELFVKAD